MLRCNHHHSSISVHHRRQSAHAQVALFCSTRIAWFFNHPKNNSVAQKPLPSEDSGKISVSKSIGDFSEPMVRAPNRAN